MKSKTLYPMAAMCGLIGLVFVWPMVMAEDAAPEPAKVELKSMDALEVTKDGVLFVADSVGAAVYALELDLPASKAKEDEPPISSVERIDEKIAALLGTSVREIAVEDMAVHEASRQVFLAVTRGRGAEAQPVLLQFAPDGKISEVALEGTRHTRLSLSDAPKWDETARRNPRTLTVTDLEMVDGELLIAGLSNEEFASTLRRAPYPFKEDEIRSTGLEIYHGAHGKFETHAPIFTFMPLELEGKSHLLAGYLCTPLVTFPMEEIRSKDRLRGKTIAELGWGNVPTDLVPFRQDGEDWVLVANSRRGTMKLKVQDILAAQKLPGITSEVGPRTGIEDHSVSTGHVAQASRLDDDHLALLVRSMEDGALHLIARSTVWI